MEWYSTREPYLLGQMPVVDLDFFFFEENIPFFSHTFRNEGTLSSSTEKDFTLPFRIPHKISYISNV